MTAESKDKSETPDEKRTGARFKQKIDAWLQILFPEETFQPKQHEAEVLDISVRGMKLLVAGVSEGFFRSLINRKRYGRVSLIDPKTGDKLKISGLLVWYDYHSPAGGTDEAGRCMMGVYFDKTETSNLGDYVAFVRRNTVPDTLWEDF